MLDKLAVPQLSVVSQYLTEWPNKDDRRPQTDIRSRHLSIHHERRYVTFCILRTSAHFTPQTQNFLVPARCTAHASYFFNKNPIFDQ
jgi:hypothetical protein